MIRKNIRNKRERTWTILQKDSTGNKSLIENYIFISSNDGDDIYILPDIADKNKRQPNK